MTAIWSTDNTGWRLLAPVGFPDEATLHDMVEKAPQMLPLAGNPDLTVLGREVQLGNGFADLIAVETSGRLAVIEVKLRRNAEARRAIVAQVLTYASYLRGMDAASLEQTVLRRHLTQRGYSDIAAAVLGNDQSASLDITTFKAGLVESLREGWFRLVLVLDEASDELVRLVTYLESVTDKLLIDLITVAAYEVGGQKIILPQRMEGERPHTAENALPAQITTTSSSSQTSSTGQIFPGVDEFSDSILRAAAEEQIKLQRLLKWAQQLEAEGLITLDSFRGKDQGEHTRWTLLPRLRTDKVGLITIWNDHGAYISFWRSVFERRAPQSLPRLETLIAPVKVGQGTSTRDITDNLLDAIMDAYREAASGHVTVPIFDVQTN